MRRLLLAASFPLLLAGCLRDNASHCGNQAGNSSCADLNSQAPFCNICTAVNDGCVAEAPSAACAFGASGTASNAAGTASAGSGTTPGPTTSSEDPTGSAADTASPETSATGDAPATTGGAQQECGNGEVEGAEQCDGSVDESSCAALGWGQGTVSCGEDCNLDTTMCESAPVCGNGTVEDPPEQCDTADTEFPKSCEEYDGEAFVGGTARCADNCRVDTSNCDACIPQGLLMPCVVGQGQCCPGLSCTCVVGCSCTPPP